MWTYVNWSGVDPEKKAKNWLQRTKSRSSEGKARVAAPLHISFDVDEDFEPDVAEMEHVLNFLKPELRRWQSLSLHVDREQLEAALELCDRPAPMLRHLTLKCAESEGLDEIFILFNEQTPALRTLQVRGVPVDWNGPMMRNLTSLSITDLDDGVGPSVQELETILIDVHGLAKLVLDNAGVCRSSADFSPKLIIVPNLRWLQMTRLDRDVYVWFVRYVRAKGVTTFVGSDFEETIGEIDVTANCPFPCMRTLRAQHSE